jgi:predicted ribonuclease YlaK
LLKWENTVVFGVGLRTAEYKHQIILARTIIPLSNRDIGFLLGGAEDKASPCKRPLFDYLKFIKAQVKETENKLRFKMNYRRKESFL